MKCQFCVNEATVHLTEIVNGQLTEIHLCEEHAREKGSDLSLPFSSSDLLSSFSEALNEPGFLKGATTVTCPECGLTYEAFSKQGRLGCADCYKSFQGGLLSLIRKVQRSTTHQGKHPLSTHPAKREELQMIRLEKQLEQAVSTENYEEAAKLRDEIRKLEKKKKSIGKGGA